MTHGPESADAPRRSRRAADVPVDATAGPRERESQQRARDREALRAYKALAEKQARPAESANPPTRRQLRQAQQQQRGAVPAPGAEAAAPGASAPAVKPAPVKPPAAEKLAPGKPAPSKPPAAEKSAPGKPAPSKPPAAEKPAPGKSAPGKSAVVPGSLPAAGDSSRRDRRRRTGQEPAPAGTAAPEAAPAADPNADVAGMSVEQALVAREALQAQARNQVAAMEAIAETDPHAVDLELLAQQKALAERAAVLNRRTQNIQRLSQENEQRKPSANDPTTAHNLAMVTPLEFVRVPGVDRPMMRRPPTSHVPIVTSNTPKQLPPGAPAAPQGTPRGADKRFEVRRPSGAADVRHSRILARADALVNAPLDPAEGAKPIGARSAFGLDPLDVMTAGLGRTRRLRFVSLGIGGLGLLALVASVVMIIGGFGS